MMGLAQAGTIIRSGDPLAVKGMTPAGIAIAGNIAYRAQQTAEQPWQMLASASIIAPALSSSAIDTTGAVLLVGSISYGTNSPDFVFSDSQGNIWTIGPSIDNTGTAVRNALYYCINPNTSPTHVFSLSGSLAYSASFIAAFKGPHNSFDKMSSNNNNNAVAYSNALPAITPSANNSLLISGIGHNYAVTGIDSGFQFIGNQQFINGIVLGGGMAYFIQNEAASIAPTWALVVYGFMYSAATLASFIPA